MDLQYIFTSFDGRINRAKWWAGAAILVIALIVLRFVVHGIFGVGFIGGFVLTLVALALFFPSYALCAKRFQDRDRPGKTALYGLVPLFAAILLVAWGLTGTELETNAVGWLCRLVYLGVLIWFVIDLGILRGTPGPNKFGGDPLAALE